MTDYFVHPKALCESDSIGPGTRVWAFAHVLPGARIGSECNICDGVFIEGDTIVGDRTTIKCGVQLWNGVRLGNDVFVGPNATFTNDPFPRSRKYPEAFAETIIEDGASIGAKAMYQLWSFSPQRKPALLRDSPALKARTWAVPVLPAMRMSPRPSWL